MVPRFRAALRWTDQRRPLSAFDSSLPVVSFSLNVFRIRDRSVSSGRSGIWRIRPEARVAHTARRADHSASTVDFPVPLNGPSKLCRVAEYRIDDLARAGGTSVRNVRVYQDRDLLPAPERRGRTAIYGDAHLSRLRLILNMLERGYAFAQIKEMLDAWAAGHSLADVLGLEAATGAAWSQEQPAVITVAELARMFGTRITPANLRRALDLGILERRDGHLVAPSPKLLDAGHELVSLGVPLAEALALAAELQTETDRVTGLLITMVRRYVLDPHGPDWLPSGDELPRFAEVISRLHPLVMSALSAAVDRSARRGIPEIMGDRLIAMAERARAERGD